MDHWLVQRVCVCSLFPVSAVKYSSIRTKCWPTENELCKQPPTWTSACNAIYIHQLYCTFCSCEDICTLTDRRTALLFGSNESGFLLSDSRKTTQKCVTVLLRKGTVMLHHGKRSFLVFWSLALWKFWNAPLLCFDVSINLFLTVNICVLLWRSVTSLRGRRARARDSGLVLLCIHVLGRRWSPQQGGKPSWFPSSNPTGAAAVPGLETGQACPGQTTPKLRSSTFSATPVEKAKREKKFVSVCQATELGDGLERSEEPHEALTNGWMKKVPAASLIFAVPF